MTMETLQDIQQELLQGTTFFFVNFCIFPRFKVLQMMLHTLVEMLASEDVKMEEWKDLNDAYQQTFQ